MHKTVKCSKCGSEQKIETKYDLLKSVRDALVTAQSGIAGHAHSKKTKVQCTNCGEWLEIKTES